MEREFCKKNYSLPLIIGIGKVRQYPKSHQFEFLQLEHMEINQLVVAQLARTLGWAEDTLGYIYKGMGMGGFQGLFGTLLFAKNQLQP